MNTAARSSRLVLLLAVAALAVPASLGAADPGLRERLAPLDYRAEDGPVAMARSADGTRWSAWSYRSGLETDIAVARQVGRVWSEAELLDRGNGLLDEQPTIAFLADGRPVVAWRQVDASGRGTIVVSVLTGSAWSAPEAVTDAAADASQPRLVTLATGLMLVWVADGSRLDARLLFPEIVRGASVDEVPTVDIPMPGTGTNEGDDPEADSGSNGPDPMPTRTPPPGGDPDSEYSIKDPTGPRRLK
ncbi:MAG: hypothetical protein D6738_05955 [Acidobacteria bacterium]|nr:MAG: hypothetical protein D6738_05955 [Acidobacteriota bacterium]